MLPQIDVVLDSLRTFLTELGAFLPRLIGALAILIAGWIVARLFRAGVSKGLHAIRFDELAKKSGIDDALRAGDVPLTLNGVLSGLVYWFVMLVALLAAINSLGLTIASDLFSQIVLYLPNVLVAVVILVVGALFAKLVRGVVGTYVSSAQIDGGRVISAIAYYAILVFAVFVALQQLKIGQDMLLAAFRLSFGAVALALALAFGLGGKDWAARVIDRTFGRQ